MYNDKYRNVRKANSSLKKKKKIHHHTFTFIEKINWRNAVITRNALM